MTLAVAIKGWEAEPWAEEFRAQLQGREVVLMEDIFDPSSVTYAAVWKHEAGALAQFSNLKVIFSLGAGVDHVFLDPELPDVPVVRVVDPDLTQRMSEWVLLHTLIHHRQQRMYDYQQSEAIWADDRFQPAAHSVRVGIMGLGELGADAARKLAMVGFDVAGWARSPKQLPGITCFSGLGSLSAFLARTDILVCLLPLTPQTQGMLNAPLLRQLARDGRLGGSILLNAGRGGLQVEADILQCLEEGSLKAATLDVFETEPLPRQSPLWQHPAVTVTPHNAAASEPQAIVSSIARQIAAFEAGQPMAGVVGRHQGY